jgi:uncharacterized protein (DUF2267 family)
MSTTGLPAIDHTVQLTNEWLRELMRMLDWEDKHRAYRLLRVTLQSLRDWLSVDEASNLGAQLPTLVRGIYYEGWHPAGIPIRPRRKEDFLARIEKAFTTDPIDDTEAAVSAVFALLDRHVTAGEVKDVRQAMTKHLQELWPA